MQTLLYRVEKENEKVPAGVVAGKKEKVGSFHSKEKRGVADCKACLK